jgi:RluA family pseudouridine synthase
MDVGMDVSDPGLVRLSCRVDRSRSGRTLTDFLALRFRYLPSDTWLDRIHRGSVTVNGAAVDPEATVRTGDEIEYAFVHVEPEVDFRYEILHESSTLLAVGKSGNLPVHAAGVFIRHTLMAVLAARYGRSLFLVHRLDRETSGVVLVARDRETARALELSARTGALQKEYLAIVHGELTREVVCDAPIGRDPTSRAPRFLVCPDGKPAVTRFVPIASARATHPALHEAPISLVRARPETGRTHQIRVHAHALGFPLVGDKVYLAPRHGAGVPGAEGWRFRLSPEEARQVLGAPRQLLHCAAVELPGVGSSETLRVRAPLPEDFREAWPGSLV